MANLKTKHIPSFRIDLSVEKETLFQQNIFGAHEQYVVFANNAVGIARFFDPESANAYCDYLINRNFAPLKKTTQGMKILEIIYEETQKIKLNQVDRNSKGQMIIRDINDRKFQA